LKATKPDVSVIIPVRGRLALTRRCLESVLLHADASQELIVVDNGSGPATRRYLDRERRAGRLILDRSARNLPFAEAINRGMKRARGALLIWLNNDAVVTPQWTRRLRDCLRRDPAAGAAGPCTNHELGGARRGARHDPPPEELDRFAAAWSLRFDAQSEEVDQLSGFCLALRREAYEAAGPLDERFRWGYEDEDYSFRLRLAGCRLLLARDVFVRHEGSGTLSAWGSRRRRAVLRSNRALFKRKWVGLGGEIRSQVLREFREKP
jgi:GT2 family glycosyltransferase